MNIQKTLEAMGFSSIPQSFYNQIDGWRSWYDGDVKDFHHYSVFNGIEDIECKRYSVGMAKKVCEDWANLLMNEKVKITIDGEREQEFVDRVLAENNFAVKSNEMQERKAALGTVAYIPMMENMLVKQNTGEVTDKGAMRINYCTASAIYPASWDNGIIRECAFVSKKTIDGKQYTYMQLHRLVNGLYDIENHLYYADEEVPLASVRGFETVPEVVHTESDKPRFIIDRPNIANTDEENPMGISVYAHAIDQLKAVDVVYDTYVNEFVLGKKRIVVRADTVNLNGRPAFDKRETVYYVLPEDVKDTPLLEQVDMTLRTEEFNAGLQDMFNVLSSKCGFGENHYRYDKGNITTATQVISENSTMYNTIKKHEIILEQALTGLCRVIMRMGNQYMGAGLNEEAKITIDFDDSVIEDKSQERNDDRQDLANGTLNDWEYRSRWRGEDEETAKKMLPKMQDMTDGTEEIDVE